MFHSASSLIFKSSRRSNHMLTRWSSTIIIDEIVTVVLSNKIFQRKQSSQFWISEMQNNKWKACCPGRDVKPTTPCDGNRIKQWTIDRLRFCWVSTNNRAIMCLLFRCQVLGIVCCHYLNIRDDVLWQKCDTRTLCWYFCRATTIWKSCVTTNAQYLTRGT